MHRCGQHAHVAVGHTSLLLQPPPSVKPLPKSQTGSPSPILLLQLKPLKKLKALAQLEALVERRLRRLDTVAGRLYKLDLSDVSVPLLSSSHPM